MTKRFGFTLAEVLITLGIIGVVAAMTMPTLINQTQGAQYKAAYKKALSAVAQGVTLNVALDDVSFADTVAGTAGSATAPSNGASVASLLNARMNVSDVKSATPYTQDPLYKSGATLSHHAVDTWMFFNDGSMFAFKNTADGATCADGTKICKGYIDVNGLKGPNKFATCDTASATAADGLTSDGKSINQSALAASCTVSSPTDLYDVYYYDQTIVPATNAAKAVLYGK